jgi:hypothetical protein
MEGRMGLWGLFDNQYRNFQHSGSIILPFLVFLAAQALLPPRSPLMLAGERAAALVVGVGLSGLLMGLYHHFFDVPDPNP